MALRQALALHLQHFAHHITPKAGTGAGNFHWLPAMGLKKSQSTMGRDQMPLSTPQCCQFRLKMVEQGMPDSMTHCPSGNMEKRYLSLQRGKPKARNPPLIHSHSWDLPGSNPVTNIARRHTGTPLRQLLRLMAMILLAELGDGGEQNLTDLKDVKHRGRAQL